MTTKSPNEHLRILAIVNLPWDARLGAARVWIELAKEWTEAGHVVEKYCLTDAYPQPERSRPGSTLRQARFPWHAAAYLRNNADRFDIVDGLIGVLPFTKESLRFRGLLVARSVGLFRLYDQFLRQARTLWPDEPKGRWFGTLFHRYIAWRSWKDSEKSIRVCDLLNLPNEDERRELAADSAIRAPAIVQPYGLNAQFRDALAAAARPAVERLQGQKICFIGMWSLRKGSRDWPRIIESIRRRHPAAEFLFLGTLAEEDAGRAELGGAGMKGIFFRPHFEERELPALLADCALALFPSYIEGFGLAVLEQLAAGLPAIAYEVPGPRQILQPLRERLLTPVGDIAAIATRAAEILSLSVANYAKLSADCRALAQSYRWDEIARASITQYRIALASLGQASSGGGA